MEGGLARRRLGAKKEENPKANKAKRRTKLERRSDSKRFSTISVGKLNDILGENAVKLPVLKAARNEAVKVQKPPPATVKVSKEKLPLSSRIATSNLHVLQNDVDAQLDRCIEEEQLSNADRNDILPQCAKETREFTDGFESVGDRFEVEENVPRREGNPEGEAAPKEGWESQVASSRDAVDVNQPRRNSATPNSGRALQMDHAKQLDSPFFRGEELDISRTLSKKAALRADLDAQILEKKQRQASEEAKRAELDRRNEVDHREASHEHRRSDSTHSRSSSTKLPSLDEGESIESAVEALRVRNRIRATQSVVFSVEQQDTEVDSETKRRIEKESLKAQMLERKRRKEDERQKEEELQRLDDERVARERRILEERWERELRAESTRVSVHSTDAVETATSRSPGPLRRPQPKQPLPPQLRRHSIGSQRRTPSPAPLVSPPPSVASPASSSNHPSYKELSRICHDLSAQHQRLRQEMNSQSWASESLLTESQRNHEVIEQIEALKKQVEALSMNRTPPPPPPPRSHVHIDESVSPELVQTRPQEFLQVARPTNSDVSTLALKKRPSWATRSKACAPLANVHESVDLDSITAFQAADGVDNELCGATEFIFPGEKVVWCSPSSPPPPQQQQQHSDHVDMLVLDHRQPLPEIASQRSRLCQVAEHSTGEVEFDLPSAMMVRSGRPRRNRPRVLNPFARAKTCS